MDVFLCIFAYPKFIPGSVEASLGLWRLGSAGSQDGSWAWNWKKKKGFCAASCGSTCSGPAPAGGWWPWGVCPKPRAGPGGVSCGSCGLWLQIWGILPAPGHGCSLGHLQDLQRGLQGAAPEACSALEVSWFIPGNPGCSCPLCGAEGWEFPGLFPSSQGSPVGSQSCSRYFSLLLGCVSCPNIPSEEFSHVGTPGQFPDGCTGGVLSQRDSGLSLWIPRSCRGEIRVYIHVFSTEACSCHWVVLHGHRECWWARMCLQDVPSRMWGTRSLPSPVALGKSFSEQY